VVVYETNNMLENFNFLSYISYTKRDFSEVWLSVNVIGCQYSDRLFGLRPEDLTVVELKTI